MAEVKVTLFKFQYLMFFNFIKKLKIKKFNLAKVTCDVLLDRSVHEHLERDPNQRSSGHCGCRLAPEFSPAGW